MNKILLALMVLFPQLLMAGTDCWIKDYPDYTMLTCIGDEFFEPEPIQSTDAVQSITPLIPQVAGNQQSRPDALGYSTVVNAAAAPTPGARRQEAKLAAGQTKITEVQVPKVAVSVSETWLQQSREEKNSEIPNSYRAPRSVLNKAMLGEPK